MLVIRLARTGRHKYPVYRLVAADKRKAANGKFVSVLGHYNPHTKQLVMDKEQITKYMQNGAQPSNRVIKLLQAEKVEMPAWAVLQTKNRKPKKEPDAKAEAPAKAEEATEEAAQAEPTESVAESATEQEASVEANASDTGDLETAATEEAQADAASEAQETAAEVATEAAEEQA